MQLNKINRYVIVFGSLISWFAVLLQLYLIIVNRQTSVAETIIRFFSFFTILTNILVAICFTCLAIKTNNSTHLFFSNEKVLSAITVYITIVSVVYNLVLRFLWAPQGLQRLADELLHSVIPLLFILYWCLFVPKASLKWKDAFVWLLYPLVYLAYILLRGAFSGFYPYPFIDVTALGYEKILLNCLILFAAFLAVSFLLIGSAKWIVRKNKTPAF